MGSRMQLAAGLMRAASTLASSGIRSSGSARLQAVAASAFKQAAGSAVSSSVARCAGAASSSRSLHRAPLSALAQSLLGQSSSSARYAATHAAPAPSHEPLAAPTLLSTVGTAAAATSGTLEGSGEEEDEENLGPRRKRKRFKHPEKLSPDKQPHLSPSSSPETPQQPSQHELHNKHQHNTSSLQGDLDHPGMSQEHARPPHQEQDQEQELQAGAEDGAEGKPEVYILTAAERLQPPLTTQDSIFLWKRSEEMARLGVLQRARLGKGGPTRAWLSKVGDLLESHELVRVDVPQEQWDVELIKELLEATQDCVTIKAKGHTITLYRDSSLPRPPASRADVDLEESVRAAALRSPRDPVAALRVHQPGSQEWRHVADHQQQQEAAPSSSIGKESQHKRRQARAYEDPSIHSAAAITSASSSSSHTHDPEFMAAWQERKRLLAEQRSSSSSSRSRARSGAVGRDLHGNDLHEEEEEEEEIRPDVGHDAYDADSAGRAGSSAGRSARVARMLALRAALRERRLAAAGA